MKYKYACLSFQTTHSFYPALVVLEQAICIDWINSCYILSLIEMHSFFWYPCYLWSFGSVVANPVHFLLTGNIKKGASKG